MTKPNLPRGRDGKSRVLSSLLLRDSRAAKDILGSPFFCKEIELKNIQQTKKKTKDDSNKNFKHKRLAEEFAARADELSKE